MNPSFYVEFVGPHGSGKTTICKQTMTELYSRGYSVESRRGRRRGAGRMPFAGRGFPSPLQAAKFLAFLPLCFTRILYYCIKMSLSMGEKNFKGFRFFLKESFSLKWRLLCSNDVTLYDQGPVFKSINLSPGKDCLKYLKLLLKDSEVVIVIITIPPRELARRLAGRKNPEKIMVTAEKIEKSEWDIRNRNRPVPYIEKEFAEKFKASCVGVDGMKSPHCNAGIVVREIQSRQNSFSSE